MEQARIFIAIALSFIVFLLWEIFFVDKQVVEKPKQDLQTQTISKEEPYVKEINTKSVDKAPLIKEDVLKTIKSPRVIRVNTPLYSAIISEKGAVLKSFVLNKYRESVEPDSPLLEMISPEIKDGTIKIGLAGNSVPALNDAFFMTDIKDDAIEINDNSKELSFFWKSSNGIVIEKKFLFSPETYMIGCKVIIKNGSNQTIQDNLILSLFKTYAENGRMYGFEGPSALINNALEQVDIDDIEDKNIYNGELKWIAVQDRYFMSCIVPEKAVEASMRLFVGQDNVLENQFMQPESIINPGSQRTFGYHLFMGPRSTKVLKEIDYDLDKAINFGFFDILAKPCLWFMNLIYDYTISNYGIAIIILTVFTKIILWPLGAKSYKSMNEMKKIQPLVMEIREKYKGDKKKMNEATMALYKTYKVNPVGGCLPMVFQIPVFFALYRMLYEAIELRHAPFFGWINDLSAPDRLLSFDFSIPFMQPPYGIPVLTIIMGATMFLQQKISPAMGDPSQAKIMMFMPLVFTVIFINFSSGLVLYWLVNNVLSIAQQYYTTKKAA
ncbi:MAG: membrane protein insertase YidC [Proteobacteria bacterium]|nr:membrane protein insertase YidC [Pseudomonadota bacterium]MBU4258892.1 membrane protein insertase YidC [Pseudomonadota bacterium]MBU4288913.1 membrane protein insertase YidC [Pseudomonadota bacterium]MCG2758375.1 membrane protein insertase YidC [Desulfobacteraceae bacterium]